MNAPVSSAQLATVEALISARRFPEANQACDSILSQNPGDPRARYYRAMLRMHAGAPEDACAILEPLAREAPGFVAARYLLADAQRAGGRFGDAAQGYASVIAQELSLGGTDLVTRLEAIVDLIARAPVERWRKGAPALQALGYSLQKSGFDLAGSGLAERLARVPLARVQDESFFLRLNGACTVLAIDQASSPSWMRAVVEKVLLPWMQLALEAGAPANGLEIERLIYVTYVLGTESQDHFRAVFGLWLDDMRKAGKRFAATVPSVERGPGGRIPRVAFFIHNVTKLAHVTALLEVVEGHRELPEPGIEPYLFYQAGDPAVIERFRSAGVRVEQLPQPASAALAHLRRRVAEDGIEVLAWISLAIMMPFAFAMRLAPRQIWWAMKYHALEFPEIDDYVTGGGETGIHTIQGRPWRVGPVVASKWFAPELAEKARGTRGALGARGLVFGSFGRAEKLNSPQFLDAVVEILRRVPDSVFLWTGRAPLASIQQHFERAGLADRCRFIGWVDTMLYAQVIDVFLDSFPFPCGFTLYQAMAAGKPAVMFASAESEHGGINAIVGHLLASSPGDFEEAALAHSIFRPESGESLYLRAVSAAEYIDHADRLAREPAWRERVGAAGRAFVERVMTDRKRAARIYVSHLLGRDPQAAHG
jgi:glycosyltransferase involved in cell wall biosynthesis